MLTTAHGGHRTCGLGCHVPIGTIRRVQARGQRCSCSDGSGAGVGRVGSSGQTHQVFLSDVPGDSHALSLPHV